MENQHHARMGNGHDQAVKEVKHKATRVMKTARRQLKEGQQDAEHMLGQLDKQVRENPWPVIAGVAVGFYLLGVIRK